MSLWWGKTSASQQSGKLPDLAVQTMPRAAALHCAESTPWLPRASLGSRPAGWDVHHGRWLGSTGVPFSLFWPITYHKTNCHKFLLLFTALSCRLKDPFYFVSYFRLWGSICFCKKKNLELIFFSVLFTVVFQFIYFLFIFQHVQL